MTLGETLVTVVVTVFASNGFWGIVQHKVVRKDDKRDAIEDGLLAVLHDRLYQACRYNIKRNHISIEELDNLKYLYTSYNRLGGNGTGTELYERCKKLPIREGEDDA